jgi:metal-responsive CopG/Arc/MetJ family transcriptional regulator
MQVLARFARMPTKVLALHVPEDVIKRIDEHAETLCLSRSAAVRLILINELERRRMQSDEAQPEAAA